MTARKPVIAVLGGHDAPAADERLAAEVGRLLAEQEAVLLCGGRGGVMAAACRGASSAGGLCIGLLPDDDDHQANDFLTVALPTGLGHARNAVLVCAAAAVIAIGGGAGTLSEIGLALKAGRPVIGLGTWEAHEANGRPATIRTATSPDEAVAMALLAAGRPPVKEQDHRTA